MKEKLITQSVNFDQGNKNSFNAMEDDIEVAAIPHVPFLILYAFTLYFRAGAMVQKTTGRYIYML